MRILSGATPLWSVLENRKNRRPDPDILTRARNRILECGDSPPLKICSAKLLCSGLLHKLHRHAIHAVAQSGRLWTVVEYMPQVAVALRTRNLCARHA